MKKHFPLGSQVTIDRLVADPVSVYNELRQKESITWIDVHLARAEARIALERLLTRLPNCRMDPENPSVLEGYEFRAPSSMNLVWDVM